MLQSPASLETGINAGATISRGDGNKSVLSSLPMSGAMIHIIEDEPHHAILLDRALCQARFATTLAADGHTGWENVQRLMPSLILLDLMLPGMDGQEVCRLVRSTPSTRHIPIIMLSALGTEEDRISGIQMGADDYVVKPFSPREVVSRVQAVLRRSQELVSAATALSVASITVQGPYFVVSLEGRQLTVSSMELALLRAILPREGELVRAERADRPSSWREPADSAGRARSPDSISSPKTRE